MKTTKRSKMLLSSIAMLLVALVALGSASFAWYFTNTTVTAATTSAKANAADGLVIRKTTSDSWTTSISYTNPAASTGISPMSFDYTSGTTTTTGMQAAKGASNSVGTYTTIGTALDDWDDIKGAAVYDDFWVATPSAGTKSVKLTINGSTVAGTYINVVVFVDGNKVGAVTSTPSLASIGGRTKTGAAGGTLTFDTLGTQIATAFNVLSNQTGDKNGSHVEVVAYPDGENTLCTTDTAKTDAFSVDFSFSAA